MTYGWQPVGRALTSRAARCLSGIERAPPYRVRPCRFVFVPSLFFPAIRYLNRRRVWRRGTFAGASSSAGWSNRRRRGRFPSVQCSAAVSAAILCSKWSAATPLCRALRDSSLAGLGYIGTTPARAKNTRPVRTCAWRACSARCRNGGSRPPRGVQQGSRFQDGVVAGAAGPAACVGAAARAAVRRRPPPRGDTLCGRTRNGLRMAATPLIRKMLVGSRRSYVPSVWTAPACSWCSLRIGATLSSTPPWHCLGRERVAGHGPRWPLTKAG